MGAFFSQVAAFIYQIGKNGSKCSVKRAFMTESIDLYDPTENSSIHVTLSVLARAG